MFAPIVREIGRISFRQLVSSAYKRLLMMLHDDKFFVASYYGCRMLVRMGDLTGREIGRRWADRKQLSFFLRECERRHPAIFLDIGANAGLYTCVALVAGKIPRAIAFEPDRRNAANLAANLLMNDLLDRVDVHAVAVGSRSERLALVPGPSINTGVSRLAPRDTSPQDGYFVNVVRIDELLQLSGLVLFVKIDVEMHECEVLAGMTRTLRDNDGLVQIKSFATKASVIATMRECGYSQVAQFGDDLVFEKAKSA